jgi:NTP pyrophosphatase (non-canonical NTP hydrolase)
MKLNNEVFKRALEQWGSKAQIGMCIEEMGEALTAINHYDRGRIGIEKLVEEFVDVYIMMSQMRFIHQELFDTIFEQKVNRVRKKLGLEVE